MFLCKGCHAIDPCPRDFETHLHSRGPCEDCGAVARCADCPSWHGTVADVGLSHGERIAACLAIPTSDLAALGSPQLVAMRKLFTALTTPINYPPPSRRDYERLQGELADRITYITDLLTARSPQ